MTVTLEDYLYETTRQHCGVQGNQIKAAFEHDDATVLHGIAVGRDFLAKFPEGHPRRAAADGVIKALEILATMRGIA